MIYVLAYGPYAEGVRLPSVGQNWIDRSIRSKVIKGSEILEIRSHDPGHAHLGVVLSSIRREGPSSMYVPNFKRIALFVQKLLGDPKISKLGHVTLCHAHFEPETLNLCRNPSGHTCCQILCF